MPIYERPKLEAPSFTSGDGLTLILACRSEKKALEAKERLLDLLDRHILKERTLPGYDGHAEVFRKNLQINFHAVDISSVRSLIRFGEEVSQKCVLLNFNGSYWVDN